VKLRDTGAPRCLTSEQRRKLDALLVAVPPLADSHDPSVRALVAWRRGLSIPWWSGGRDFRLALGNGDDVAAGLIALRAWADDSWDAAPPTAVRRRARR
jgi:hypothetical protein